MASRRTRARPPTSRSAAIRWSPITKENASIARASTSAATFVVVLMAALMWAVWTYQGPGPAAKGGDFFLAFA